MSINVFYSLFFIALAGSAPVLVSLSSLFIVNVAHVKLSTGCTHAGGRETRAAKVLSKLINYGWLGLLTIPFAFFIMAFYLLILLLIFLIR